MYLNVKSHDTRLALKFAAGASVELERLRAQAVGRHETRHEHETCALYDTVRSIRAIRLIRSIMWIIVTGPPRESTTVGSATAGCACSSSHSLAILQPIFTKCIGKILELQMQHFAAPFCTILLSLWDRLCHLGNQNISLLRVVPSRSASQCGNWPNIFISIREFPEFWLVRKWSTSNLNGFWSMYIRSI